MLLLPFLQHFYVNWHFSLLLPHCSVLHLFTSTFAPKCPIPMTNHNFPAFLPVLSLIWTTFFSAMSNSVQRKKVKTHWRVWKEVKAYTVTSYSTIMLSPSILHLFNATLPTLLLIQWLLVSLLSLHFLPQAAEGEAEWYFALIPYSTALTIFSLESFLQESALDTTRLSASLPTSPISTSWLGYTCHSLLTQRCLTSRLRI